MTGSNNFDTAISLGSALALWCEYDSLTRSRPVFMRAGNIASTVGNQAFCSEYDRNLRLKVLREMPSTRAAFC